MNLTDTRHVIVNALKAQGYKVRVEGPSGQYFVNDDKAVMWVSWEFDGIVKTAFIETEDREAA